MKLNCLFGLVVVVGFAAAMSGCATKTEQEQGKKEDRSTATRQVSARVETSSVTGQSASNQFKLTGVWVGTSGLNVEALQTKLANLEGEERAALETRARIFDSIFMAYQFNPDSTMEIDMEIVMPNQEMIQEQAFGTWRAVPGNNHSLLVTTVEERKNAEPETTTKEFFIINENEFQIVPTNITEELRDLSPFYLFQRQSLESIPLSAEAASGNVLK